MQTELFDLPSPATIQEEAAVSKPSFLEKTFITLRLDQAIGLVLILLVFYVLIFSWGVEKGKRSSQDGQVIRAASAPVVLPEAVEPAPVPAVTVSPVVAAVEPAAKETPITVAELPKPVAAVSKPEGKYTVQHVTYITQSAADREIQKLAKLGYTAFVIPSGKHLQVCIGGFQTRPEAIQLLKQLKTKQLVSGDAYVRPMVR
ncbi:MAG TPA: SPOR domain-containing protein [Candidatus Omnitrophota bacterium]|nr:SPOR domain-containing protein [Candidatus Omnitrophota bacterium]HRY85277.1 SPOR domain-containing protein [Candidatus Omnitrophota bacterium]